jgi:dihydroxyacetone kinase-like protein
MGMALTPCTVPAAGKPNFTLGDDEMEIGMGIHGEPGTHRDSLKTADEIVSHLMGRILDDMNLEEGSEVAVMVNGLGGTPLMELFVANGKVHKILAEKDVKVYRTYVGEFMTSIEMAGFSISLLKLDEELKALLDAKADTPAFKQL